jgi:UTP--glucose-1-phosphate uridylyltransferase
MNKVKKAVFPVAGMGTRFLPATKASPKEMMPVVDKPLIQYAVEEAVEAGITEMIFITGRGKRAIEDHFDKAYELEAELEVKNKTEMLEVVRNIVPSNINCIFIRQMQPLGLGHAVLCARPVIGDEPFAVLLADDLMHVEEGQKGVTRQMVEAFEREHASLLAVQQVPKADTKSYGIVSSTPWNDYSERVRGIVEKPDPEEAPTNLAVVGRYVLTSRIFDHILKTGKGAGGEIQLTDGIASLLDEQPVLAYRFTGTRFDCGSKLGYLKATVELGKKHPQVGTEFQKYLEEGN